MEMIGLHHATNGRSCTSHKCCGKTLEVNQVLRLRKCVVDVLGEPEEAIKCVRIEDGSKGCVVGFLPKALLKVKKLQHHFMSDPGPFVQVTEIYSDSESLQKHCKSHSNFGMASIVFLRIYLCKSIYGIKLN